MAWSRVAWHLFSTVTSFHHLDFLTGYWLMFLLLNLLTSGIIIFILLSKQPLFGKLNSWNSKGGPLSVSRLFLDQRFDRRPYPGMFSWDIRLQLGRGCTTSPARIKFAPQYLCSLEGLSVAPCGLFSRMCLYTIDSARDVSNNQWVACVPFDCLFDVLFGFL